MVRKIEHLSFILNAAQLQDIRDLRKNGFLLSHTVLPFVVQENALSTQIYPTDGDIYTHSFKDFFQHWVEPSEYDFLRVKTI